MSIVERRGGSQYIPQMDVVESVAYAWFQSCGACYVGVDRMSPESSGISAAAMRPLNVPAARPWPWDRTCNVTSLDISIALVSNPLGGSLPTLS